MRHPHPRRLRLPAALAALGLLLVACGGGATEDGPAGEDTTTPAAERTPTPTEEVVTGTPTPPAGPGTPGGMPPAPFAVTSAAFEPGGPIPVEFSCDGAGTSIPLDFTRFDARTQTLAIIFEDPDAPRGTFIHWIAWNIPPGNIEAGALPAGSVEGVNDTGATGYQGPCPPAGQSHRYIVTAYEVDTTIALGEFGIVDDLLKVLEGHVINEATYQGVYPGP